MPNRHTFSIHQTKCRLKWNKPFSDGIRYLQAAGNQWW
ncbi:hypothetical protein F528_2237 [Neisseria meningitidis 992008]|uniref:Uncharacterized protein n=1 Tax=Neisseria meningitidis TaxID=487 RepID=X5EKN7_NEIME|nr:hypothetical protein NMA510612_1937 [Neisseria meningitidis]KER38780.1 hypothetical protein F528_2237 [Neisseria meningitidis 992008]